MKLTYSLLGVTGIATAILLDAAPSKAIMYIDFIPLSPTSTRIQASGSLTPSSLGASTSSTQQTNPGPSGTNTSRLDKGADTLRFTYSNSAVASIAGSRYAISGTDPFIGGGVLNWTGTTPVNNPPLILRLGTTKDIWLPSTYTGGAIVASFDVNFSLAAIFGASAPSQFAFTSGTEQIILRNNPTLVPGPLPLLGAAAAFGYSRKLRNRIQKSTSARLA